VYLSSDAGQTWKEQSTLPLASYNWELDQMRFGDTQQGQIDIYNIADSQSSADIDCSCMLSFTTSDAGRTWKVSNPFPIKDSAARKAYLQTQIPIKFDRSSGFDGSDWQLSHDIKADVITVLRGLKGQTPVTVSTIPQQWSYKQGQILPR
jgi:hypothetical protein